MLSPQDKKDLSTLKAILAWVEKHQGLTLALMALLVALGFCIGQAF